MTQKFHVAVQTAPGDHFPHRTEFRALADHKQDGRDFLPDRLQHINHRLDVLDLAKIRGMQENKAALFPEPFAQRMIRSRVVSAGIHEIGNDGDIFSGAEHADRLVLQEMGNSGHGIALFDDKAGDGEKCGFLTHQRDVRAVQGRDHRQPARQQHLPCQIGAGGMGYGVMDMKQVQFEPRRHIEHGRRQTQSVGGMLEHGILRHFHLVVNDVAVISLQAKRKFAGNEVDLATAPRQMETQFGGDHAAAALAGITGNADVGHAHQIHLWPGRSDNTGTAAV